MTGPRLNANLALKLSYFFYSYSHFPFRPTSECEMLYKLSDNQGNIFVSCNP